MTGNELLKRDNPSDIRLALFNEQGEGYRTDSVRTLVNTKKGLKIRWSLETELENTYPLTHAALYSKNRVLGVFPIRPLLESGTEVEVYI